MSGHRYVLEETSTRNRVELVVNGMVVFSCDIKQLQFGETCDLTVGVISLYFLLNPFKVAMGNWTLFAKRLSSQWRMLTD